MSLEEKIHRYVENQKRLLELELRSEEDEADDSFVDARGGHIIRNLKMDHISVGLIGKTVVHFVNGDDENPILPTHRFAVGDEVEVLFKQSDYIDKKRKKSSGGVLCQITDTSISLSLFDNSNSDEIYFDGLVCIVPGSSTEVHKKMLRGLDELQRAGGDHEYCGKVIDAIFNPSGDLYHVNYPEFIPFNKNLDESQKQAIAFCLGSEPITLIHGPPGTGKTTTIVELIRQAVEVTNLRVLVTAPSNQAVDNILEKLDNSMGDYSKKKKLRLVRLGHPARIHPSILKYSLESLVKQSDGTEIVRDIRQELKSFLDISSSPKTRGIERRAAYREIKLLRKEIKEREVKIISSIIGNAQIVLATNVGAASNMLDKHGKLPFDLVIIDEAAQAIEASCWIPVMRGKRLVLAGDHRQLPPTIKCKRSDVVKELSRTLFERIMQENVHVSRMLRIQYRMHESISDWSSKFVYDGKLLSHDSVRLRKLSHLPSFIQTSTNDDSILSISGNATLLLIDTAGNELFESIDSAGSRFNEGEAYIVRSHVQNLIALGIKVEDIAVISPYNAQIELLKKLLLDDYPTLEIRSVDGFQGGEREAIVLSLVRSSERGGIEGVGFLRDNRRLNVAVTRAKRQCTVVCDSETVSQDEFLKQFLGWIEVHGEYMSSNEYVEETIQEKRALSNKVTKNKTQVEDILKSQIVQIQIQYQGHNQDQHQSKYVPANFCIDSDHISREKELEEQLAFFAEVVDDPNEQLHLKLPQSQSLLSTLNNLCSSFALKVVEEKEDQHGVSVVISKCPPPVFTANFDNIKTDLILFSQSADFDEYYDFAMTPDINLFELERLCNDLKLTYESIPGKFVVQRRGDDADINEDSPIGSELALPVHQEGSLDPLDSDDSSSHANARDKVDKNVIPDRSLTDIENKGLFRTDASMPINMDATGSKKDKIVRGIKDGHNQDIALIAEGKATESITMNKILSSLAQERLARKEESKKRHNNAQNKSKTYNSRNNTKELFNDMDDMTFLDMQIDRVMNSHGRRVEGNGKNYRSIINGSLLPKPKVQDVKSRDTRAADALARKLKEAQIARRAKPKKS